MTSTVERLRPSTDARVGVASDIAVVWNDAGLRYAVVNGLGNYPRALGRDLDVVIERRDVGRAVEIARAVGSRSGYGTSFVRWSWWGLYQLVLVNDADGSSLPIDLLCTTTVWRAKIVRVVTSPDLTRLAQGDDSIGPFSVSREGEFLKTCVRALLCGDLRRFRDEIPLPTHPPKPHDAARAALGRRGWRLLTARTVDELAPRVGFEVAALQTAWTLRHPISAARSVGEALVGRALRAWFNRADVVTVHTAVAAPSRDRLHADMLRLFVDARLVVDPTPMETLLGLLWRWRPLPVSEFGMTVVVRTGGDRCPILSSFSRRMRADGSIDIRRAADPYRALRLELVRFLARKHAGNGVHA